MCFDITRFCLLSDSYATLYRVTAERLQMVSFTLPVTYDRIYLVIPRPSPSDSLGAQTQKVMYVQSNHCDLVQHYVD